MTKGSIKKINTQLKEKRSMRRTGHSSRGAGVVSQATPFKTHKYYYFTIAYEWIAIHSILHTLYFTY